MYTFVSLGGEAAGSEVGHLFTPNAEVNQGWTCIYTPPVYLR